MLTSIKIKNFKSIIDTSINCNEDYNVFIGANNAGKTTVFEAIHLWKMCYDINVKKKNDGFYSSANCKNILFRYFENIRVVHDEDLFNSKLPNGRYECSISLKFRIEDEFFELGFVLTKPTKIDDAYLQVSYIDYTEFARFTAKINSFHGSNVANAVSIYESRPIANIIANEPKMTMAEIKEKSFKGKSNEVLRNKILSNEHKIEEHIEAICRKQLKFSSSDRRGYIDMKIDGKDILSYGSGFIQLVELFASIEYSSSYIKILLIDEPDAHIHVQYQRALVNRLQNLSDYQLFIISHNIRFVNETQDSKLFYLRDVEKPENTITSIDPIMRPLLIEGLTGIATELDKWQTAQKILLVEGETDINFLNVLLPKYAQITGNINIIAKIYNLHGIDALYNKIGVLAPAVAHIVPNRKWLLIRDTDCFPLNKIREQKQKYITAINTFLQDFNIFYQNGYGIESTFISDDIRLAKILHQHYTTISIEDIKACINEVNNQFNTEIHKEGSRLYDELHKHFDRQKRKRENIYKMIVFEEVLADINSNNIQYIMTKEIVNQYYEELHKRFCDLDNTIHDEPLSSTDILSLYINGLNSLDVFYQCHIDMIDEINRI